MRSNAAVFRGGHGALTVEAVDIDRTQGREVVRVDAAGLSHGALRALNAMAVARSVLVFD